MKKTIMLGILFLVGGTLSMSPVSALAAESNSKVLSQPSVSSGLSEALIKRADSDIIVVNNRYQLKDSAVNNFSSGELSQLKKALKESNQLVANQKLTIDPQTKTIAPEVLFAAYNRRYTMKIFWWGTGYYFTSNAVVAQMSNVLAYYTFAFNIGGTIGGIVAKLASGLLGSYTTLMSARLNSFNNSHPHNQIYMDVNQAGVFSFHILK